MKKLLLPLLMAAALAGCGDGGEETPAAEESARPVTVTVTMTDSTPLEVLQNYDDELCTSINNVAALLGEDVAPVEVTLRDAEGAIVATETLPETGGSMDGNTCTWDLKFTVDESDFFEATVRAPSGETKATGQTEGGAVTITLTL